MVDEKNKGFGSSLFNMVVKQNKKVKIEIQRFGSSLFNMVVKRTQFIENVKISFGSSCQTGISIYKNKSLWVR